MKEEIEAEDKCTKCSTGRAALMTTAVGYAALDSEPYQEGICVLEQHRRLKHYVVSNDTEMHLRYNDLVDSIRNLPYSERFKYYANTDSNMEKSIFQTKEQVLST